MNKFGNVRVGGSYFAMISPMDESLMVTVVDSETEKVVMCFPIKMQFKTIKEFVNMIPNFFSNFKVVILQLFCFQTPEYPNMIEFRKEIRAKLDRIKKPHHFMEEEDFYLSYLINSKTVELKLGERFVYIYLCDDDEIDVSEYECTANGYKRCGNREIYGIKSKNESTICKSILGPNNPNMIILSKETDTPAIKRLLKIVLKGKNVKVLDMTESFPKAMVDAGKWILNGKKPQRPIIPFCALTCSMGYKCVDEYYPAFAKIDAGEELPITKSFSTTKFVNEVVVALHDANENPGMILAEISTPPDCHRNYFTFTVDKENFPIFDGQKSIINEICDLPAKLNKALKSKIPVIGFCDNFSIICTYKDDIKHYKCLDEWNGIFGKDFCVSFDQKKPEYCEIATEKLKSKRSSVVFDLLYIMSKKPENIQIRSFWGFTITKDDKNPVLIEFESFDGTKKAASPVFLVALLLKEHIKAIKNEIGEKPEKLGFWSFDDFNKEEKTRIQKGLEDACKLLKTESTFIEI